MTTNSGTYIESPPDGVDLTQDDWDNLSYDMQYYYANEERQQYLKDKAAEIDKRNREYVDSVKEDAECKQCGEEHPATLDFHHTGEKTNEVSTLVSDEYSLDRIKDEMEKCVILCANCHRKKHA